MSEREKGIIVGGIILWAAVFVSACFAAAWLGWQRPTGLVDCSVSCSNGELTDTCVELCGNR